MAVKQLLNTNLSHFKFANYPLKVRKQTGEADAMKTRATTDEKLIEPGTTETVKCTFVTFQFALKMPSKKKTQCKRCIVNI